MATFHVTQEKAFDHVQARRFCISPNQNFQHQLEAYQYIQQAAMSIATDKNAGSRPADVRRKRADDSEDEAELERTLDAAHRYRDDPDEIVPPDNVAAVADSMDMT